MKDHNGKIIKRNPDDVLMVQGNHEAIVGEDTWDSIHEKRIRIAERYKKSASQVHVHILSGIIRCPVCGKPLVGSLNKTKNYATGEYYYKKIAYYECRYNRKQNGLICSFGKRLNQEIVDGLVFRIISGLQYYREFQKALENAFGAAESVEDTEAKLKQLRMELRDTEFAKDKLGEKLDGLNPLKADYDKKYEKISEKLDTAYDRIDEIEDEIKSCKASLEALKKKTESYTNITVFLSNIREFLQKMTPEEKKELCSHFIERIDVFKDDRPDGRIIKSISFKFPLAFDGQELHEFRDSEEVVRFVLDCEKLDIPLPDTGNIVMEKMEDGSQKVIVRKPTYAAIKKYILEKFDTKVSTLYIAQIKRKYGVKIGKAYNKPENPKSRVPKCPPEKEKMILEALTHFDLLDKTTQYKEG